MATLEENVRPAIAAVESQPAEVNAAVGAAAKQPRSTSPSPGKQAANTLWKVLVVGLVIVLVLALGGMIFTVADGSDNTNPEVLVTAFTASLTGLLGLFIKQ